MVPYEVFAGVYDRLTAGFWDHHAPALNGIIHADRWAKHSFALDLACGTGAGIGYLESRGYTATGVDLSPHMLAVARSRWPGRTFIEADIRSLPPLVTFDVVICCFDSINYLLRPEEWRALFGRVNELLADGGVLVFDMLRESDLRDNWPDQHHVIELPGLLFAERYSFDETSGLGQADRTFFVEDIDQKWRRYDERHIQTTFAVGDVEAWLAEAGFVDIAVYDGEAGDEAEASSTRAIVRAAVPRRSLP